MSRVAKNRARFFLILGSFGLLAACGGSDVASAPHETGATADAGSEGQESDGATLALDATTIAEAGASGDSAAPANDADGAADAEPDARAEAGIDASIDADDAGAGLDGAPDADATTPPGGVTITPPASACQNGTSYISRFAFDQGAICLGAGPTVSTTWSWTEPSAPAGLSGYAVATTQAGLANAALTTNTSGTYALAAGVNALWVRAYDTLQRPSPDATASVTVIDGSSLVAPTLVRDASITVTNVNAQDWTPSTALSWTWSAVTGAKYYSCSFDSGPWAECATGGALQYGAMNLKYGAHTLRVVSIDGAGNISALASAASDTLYVDTHANDGACVPQMQPPQIAPDLLLLTDLTSGLVSRVTALSDPLSNSITGTQPASLDASAFYDPMTCAGSDLSFHWVVSYPSVFDVYSDQGVTGYRADVLNMASNSMAAVSDVVFTLTVTSASSGLTTTTTFHARVGSSLTITEYSTCQGQTMAGPGMPCKFTAALPTTEPT